MPAAFIIHPESGESLSFEDAPQRLDNDGLMPWFAVKAIIERYAERKPSFNVRPSDLTPSMECRRQRVWKESHPHGINPLEEEYPVEGGALHEAYGTAEIDLPSKKEGERILVMGIPMRGKMDFMPIDAFEDLKSTTPYWYPRFATKEQKAADPTLRPYAAIWEPSDYSSDIEKWQFQLSTYRVMAIKDGLFAEETAPKIGRVWRRYGGVKTDKPRYKKFEFPLLSEEELDARIGDWARTLRDGLTTAAGGDAEAWKTMPADGRQITSSRQGLWKCNRCPLRNECDAFDGSWEAF